MPNPIRLESLLQHAIDPTATVSIEQGRLIDFGAFQNSVSAWKRAFEESSSHNVALFFECASAFSSALFGAWEAAKCVWLVADLQPETLKNLNTWVDGFAGDFPDHFAVIKPHPGGDTHSTALDPNRTSLTIFTSGSSQAPKPIAKCLRQLSNEIESLDLNWRHLTSNHLVLGSVSHQHIYGLLFRVLWPLSTGRVFCGKRLQYPEDMILEMGRTPCVLISSPAHLKRLPEHLNWDTAKSNLKAIFSSGGSLPAAAATKCLAVLGIAPIEVFGSSETGGIAARQLPSQPIWRCLPGVECRISDEIIFVRSSHLADSNWHETSDRALDLGENGFELLGRADDIVKLEEKRVDLRDMRTRLLSTGFFDEAFLFVLAAEASANPSRDQLALVAVPNMVGRNFLMSHEKTELNNLLKQHLLQFFEPSCLPKRWRYIWSIPSNSQSKTTLRDLRTFFDPRRPEGRLIKDFEFDKELELEVTAKLPYFDGHFPEVAILPGVVQLDWAIRFGGELFAFAPDQFERIEALKFTRVIQANSVVKMSFTMNTDRGQMSFKIYSDQGAHANGRIRLRPHA